MTRKKKCNIEGVEENELIIGPQTNCPKCNAPPKQQELRDYDPIWLDGKIYCTQCGSFVRNWDAG